MKKRRLFCEINGFCYAISVKKENARRSIKNLLSPLKVACAKNKEKLPVIVKGHRSVMVRSLLGVDINLQHNKATNLKIAGDKINYLVVKPGEEFSFWKTVGAISKRKGYLSGLTISKNKVSKDIGGGLCQLANLIHWLVLHSPMQVSELHHHSDALFPDERRRVPFGTGTSVFYKNVDYRFINTTKQDIQLLIWQDNGDICGELRTDKAFSFKYRIVEENHCYVMENNKYYRKSKVYRLIIDKELNEIIKKELILDNHSEVLYDYSLIPTEEICHGY
jgi:vancomycin resistance protein VanW